MRPTPTDCLPVLAGIQPAELRRLGATLSLANRGSYKWSTEYLTIISGIRAFIPRTTTRSMGMDLPRSSWVRLNRLRTGVGRFQSSMHNWGLAPTPNCECGAVEQTADHILYELLAGSPDAHRERLKSRHPFVSAAQKLLHDLSELDIRAAQWTDYKWSTEYLTNTFDLRAFIPRLPPGQWEWACPDHHG